MNVAELGLTREHHAGIVELLNRLEEVRWDRCVPSLAGPTNETRALVVFGWIARPDGRADFVLLTIELHDEGQVAVGFSTSSATYSRYISERLHGETGDHRDCERVETALGPAVMNAIRRADPPPPPPAKPASASRARLRDRVRCSLRPLDAVGVRLGPRVSFMAVRLGEIRAEGKELLERIDDEEAIARLQALLQEARAILSPLPPPPPHGTDDEEDA